MSAIDCVAAKLIPANPDISGAGVRVAIYVQNLLSFIPAFYALKDGKISVKELQVVEKQSTTILITAFAVLISAMVQAATYGLYSFHTSIILSLSWMNNTNTFIYFILYIHHKIDPDLGPKQIVPQWSAWFHHVVKPLGILRSSTENHDVEATSLAPESQAVSLSKGEVEPSGNAPRHSLAMIKESAIKWAGKCWNLLRRKFVLVLGSLHLTAMAALGLWMWSSPYRYEATQAHRLNLTMNMLPLPCTNTTLLGLDVPLTSVALNRTSLVFYSVFLAPCLNLVVPAVFFLLLLMQVPKPSFDSTKSRNEDTSSMNGTPLPSTMSPSESALTSIVARAAVRLMRFVRSLWPILAGLLFLLAINLVFIIDIETTIRRAKTHQDARDESNWTFGQTLALLLLVLPMRDVYDYIRESHETERADAATEELKRAVKRNDLEVLRKVAHYASNVNAYVDDKCPSALQFAAFQGDVEIVRTLMERNANANVEGGEHGPPLVAAAFARHEDIVKALVNVKNQSLGAAVGLTDKQGMTALHYAARHGLKDTVAFLLEHNADADARSSAGQMPLHCAAEYGIDSMSFHYQDVINQLLPNANVDQVNNINGWTPLIYAAYHGRHRILEFLLQRGAAYSHRDDDGKTPLIHAAEQGHEPAVQILLDCGAEINQFDDDGKTPLIWAASKGHERIVQLLLVHGADVNRAEEDDTTPLIWAAYRGHERVVQLLLEHGAEMNQAEDSGKTPLIWAASKGHERVVHILLEYGADVNRTENDGWTPLINAACWGQMPAIETLVAFGAETERSSNDGRTMLHLAAERGRLEVVRYLLKRGADSIRADNKGQTALDMAQEKGHEEIATLLKDAMAQRKLISETEQSFPHALADVGEDGERNVSMSQPEEAGQRVVAREDGTV